MVSFSDDDDKDNAFVLAYLKEEGFCRQNEDLPVGLTNNLIQLTGFIWLVQM